MEKEQHKSKKLLVSVAGMLTGMILATAAFAFGYLYFVVGLRDFDRIKDSIEIETDLSGVDAPSNMKEGMKISVLQDKQIENILIIGSDTRNPNANGRSDAMMLLTINKKTKSLHLTSLMRAIYVSIPDDPDPAYKKNYSSNYMLNAAHTWGGARLLMKTVQRNFRVDVTRYIATDFSGFTNAINKVGGVTIELTSAEAKYLNNRGVGSFQAGSQLLNGKAALEYSRIRKLDSDFKRMERQRRVIMALFTKMKSSNPAQLTQTVEALMPEIKTNLTDTEMMSYILGVGTYSTYSFDQLMLPIETYEAMTYIRGMEMYDIDWVKNIKALHAFMES
ncbi:MAG: LCP family protein [Clostridiaceae bacterium]|nr:LCP family protein [Clostridiaceae bacterium]